MEIRVLKPILRKLPVIVLLLDLALVATIFMAWKLDRAILRSIRDSLFSQITSDPEVFKATEQQLADRYAFLIEKKDMVDTYVSQLSGKISYLDLDVKQQLQKIRSIPEQAKFITLLYSKNGGGDICGDFTSLTQSMSMINQGNGYGCCSDHSEVFLALSHIYGLTSREITHKMHAFNEVYDSDKRKWLWVDSQYALMAKDARGEYLSAMEVKEFLDNGKKIDYEFFGTEYHTFQNGSPSKHPYFSDPKSFSYLSMPLGNNVYHLDSFYQRMRFFPKTVQQFVALLLGKQPGYLVYTKSRSEVKTFYIAKMLGRGSFLLLTFLNLAALGVLIFRFSLPKYG